MKQPRLNIKITQEMKKELKIVSIVKNKSMQDAVIEAIEIYIKK